MSTFQDFNKMVIEDFRAHDGKVGGVFEGAPVLLLTTTGAKSGQERVSPVMYLEDDDRIVVFASKGGSPTNPDWYHNLVANPAVTIEVGTEKVEATAIVLPPDERDRLYARQAEVYPQFGEYEQKTTRKIPVVELVRND